MATISIPNHAPGFYFSDNLHQLINETINFISFKNKILSGNFNFSLKLYYIYVRNYVTFLPEFIYNILQSLQKLK
jgi:hypothetical protein